MTKKRIFASIVVVFLLIIAGIMSFVQQFDSPLLIKDHTELTIERGDTALKTLSRLLEKSPNGLRFS